MTESKIEVPVDPVEAARLKRHTTAAEAIARAMAGAQIIPQQLAFQVQVQDALIKSLFRQIVKAGLVAQAVLDEAYTACVEEVAAQYAKGNVRLAVASSLKDLNGGRRQ